MYITAKGGNALVAAAVLLLAGCSVGGEAQGPVSLASVQHYSEVRSADFALSAKLSVVTGVRPMPRLGAGQSEFVDFAALAKTSRTIAVSDVSNEVVGIYDSVGTRLARLTGFFEPQGMSSDAQGDLFVADTGNQRVQIYPAGLAGLPATVADSVGFPSDVDTFSNGSVLAVTNIYGAPCCTQGSVAFYTSRTLSSTISDAALAKAYFCAFDAFGNLYVDGLDVNNSFVIGEIVGGAKGRQFTPLTTSNQIFGPGGIQVTPDGHIAVLDQNANAVYTYNPPINGSLGRPVATTPLTQAAHPVGFAFTTTAKDLYTADSGIFASQAFRFPNGGDALSTINVGGQAIGVAIFPAERPKNP